MRVVYAGTPEFAAQAYRALLQAGFEIPLVLTKPSKPMGRGMRITHSPVYELAQQHNAQILQPRSLRFDGHYPEDAQQVKEILDTIAPDVIVVAAYGLILPQWVLDLPRYGCLNIHASLLPRWRGAAPIQRCIEMGDSHTGVCIMQMAPGLDTGDVVAQKMVAIGDQNAGQLHDELMMVGAELIVQTLQQIDQLHPQPQLATGVTYAHKISKEEAQLDWSAPATVLERKIRAFNPVPGASLPLDQQRVKVWQAQVLDAHQTGSSGHIIAVQPEGIDVQCQTGVLRLLELQKPGGKRLPVEQFILGWRRT